MLCFDQIDLSEGIDPAKSNNSNECVVYHYCFFNRWFKYQFFVCNGCHDLLMPFVNISDIAIVVVKGFDYHCLVHDINKYEGIRLLENSVLDDRR